MSAHISRFTLAAVAAFGFAASVHAAPRLVSGVEPVSEKVSVVGLDLASPAGAHVALQRVRWAAERVCVGEPEIRDLGAASPYRLCVKAATDNAVASIGTPRATALNGGPGHSAAVPPGSHP
jgi:UrcA family protein